MYYMYIPQYIRISAQSTFHNYSDCVPFATHAQLITHQNAFYRIHGAQNRARELSIDLPADPSPLKFRHMRALDNRLMEPFGWRSRTHRRNKVCQLKSRL